MDPRDDPSRARLASIRAEDLAALAGFRHTPGIEVVRETDRTWVSWQDEDWALIGAVMALPGSRLYIEHEGRRWPLRGRIPTDAPSGLGGCSLAVAIVPKPVQAEPASALNIEVVELRLVPSRTARPATAIVCPLAALAAWAQATPSAEFRDRVAARLGDQVVLRSLRRDLKPPPIASGTRYWGDRLLIPLGFALSPEIDAALALEALMCPPDALVLADERGFEIVPLSAFGPIDRARIRLAGGGGIAHG